MVSTIQRRAQTITPDTAGGFTVPNDEFVRFWGVVLDDTLLRFITIYDEQNGRSNAVVIENDQSLGAWEGEGIAITALDSIFAEVATPTMPKVVAAAIGSLEFLADAEATPGGSGRVILDNVLAVRLRRTLHQAIAVGTGIGQPTGLFAVAANFASQIIGAVTTANITALMSSIHPNHLASRACGWVMNPTTLATALNLPLPNNWFSTAANNRFLLSYPIIFNPYAPANQIVFGDLAYYGLKRTPQLVAGVDRNSLALSGREVRFVWTRAEGKPVVAPNADVALGILKPV